MKKTPSHFTAHVEIEQQISFFSFGFARVSEVRHILMGDGEEIKSKSKFLAESCETINSLPNYLTHNKMHHVIKQYPPRKVEKEHKSLHFCKSERKWESY